MPSNPGSSNKAKIARRVIEVLEYFDNGHREATVMDIVRRYGRPQSSTSELLSSLVELGLLYKDPHARTYSLSPRAGLLGASGQQGVVRDGRLIRLIDRLAAQTGLPVAVFGMVGVNAQVITWRDGSRAETGSGKGNHGGSQIPLSQTAAGWLLLSTLAQSRCDGMLRRLNAEAAEHARFSCAEMSARLQQCRGEGFALGPAGFERGAEVLAMLLPGDASGRRLAVGLVYGMQDQVNSQALRDCLAQAIDQCLSEDDAMSPASVEKLPTAA
jgi:DNA-binding IclR family transcriptional regulator